MMEPFAVQIYQRFLKGETIEELAQELEIPIERVERRIRAAEHYCKQHRRTA